MLPVERRLLIKVANMYYIENLKQSDIADKIGVNRTTISKYLKRAMQEGIVRISIANDTYEQLEGELEKKFSLKEVYIVDSSEEQEELYNNLGRAGLDFFERVVHSKEVVGFAWGSSVASMAENAMPRKNSLPDVQIVPLVGGPEGVETKYHVNSIITKMAEAFGARSYCLYAPAICQTAEIRNAVMQNVNYQKIAGLWEKISVVFVGVGAPVKHSNIVWRGDFGKESIEELAHLGVVGEICSVFYDARGEVVRTSLSDQTIAIDITKLKEIPYSIGIAVSPEKIPAIRGALAGRLINVLITDETTARLLNDTKDI